MYNIFDIMFRTYETIKYFWMICISRNFVLNQQSRDNKKSMVGLTCHLYLVLYVLFILIWFWWESVIESVVKVVVTLMTNKKTIALWNPSYNALSCKIFQVELINKPISFFFWKLPWIPLQQEVAFETSIKLNFL